MLHNFQPLNDTKIYWIAT